MRLKLLSYLSIAVRLRRVIREFELITLSTRIQDILQTSKEWHGKYCKPMHSQTCRQWMGRRSYTLAKQKRQFTNVKDLPGHSNWRGTMNSLDHRSFLVYLLLDGKWAPRYTLPGTHVWQLGSVSDKMRKNLLCELQTRWTCKDNDIGGRPCSLKLWHQSTNECDSKQKMLNSSCSKFCSKWLYSRQCSL